MAPVTTPVEEIDLPGLRDEIIEFLLEFFRALWMLVRNVCLTLWSYVSQAFWTVWTWPPFEAFRNEFVVAVVGIKDYAVHHPFTTAAIVILVYIFVPAVLNTLRFALLRFLGYGQRGIYRGSFAAHYQSTSYGGNVPRDSTFSRCQSHGARGYHPVNNPGHTSWD